MSASEWWCLVAVVAALASSFLCAVAPRAPESHTGRAAAALLGASLAALAAAFWVAL